jgi:uncharacterized membrane protein YhiD involved in acid resistance
MRRARNAIVLSAWAVVASATLYAQAQQLPAEAQEAVNGLTSELREAAIRLPLAALLGAVLAFRPKRRGTPERSMPVVETQIVLAVVGALIMLVVGASLARAFGIVGAANLIRYRAKIEDPKDAVVMLSTLGIGLACGVGLYGLAAFSTLFVGGALWLIESFEPQARKRFELTIKMEEGVPELRPKIEELLRRHHASYELRASAAGEVVYAIKAPPDLRTDRLSNALTALAAQDAMSVAWEEAKSK